MNSNSRGGRSIIRKAGQDNMENSDEMETHKKIQLMRALVFKKDSSSQGLDDFVFRRFLRARDLDVDKASNLLLKSLKWRRTTVPNGSIPKSQIPNHLAQNKAFFQGLDKMGRPVLLLFGARHYRTEGGLEEFKRFMVYSLDTICSRMPSGQEKFMAIGDLQGWGYSNSDTRGYLEALSILQDNYPERLGKLFLVHVPSIFVAVWKMICPFIDKKTKEKIVFLDNKGLKLTLLEHIEESQLPDVYGGKLPLVPIQDS